MSKSHMTPQLPPPAAKGVNGRWVKLGDVGVDTGTVAITDPAITPDSYSPTWEPLPARYGSGVLVHSGLGDGCYEVWGWVADFGPMVGERLAQIVVTFIGEDDEDDEPKEERAFLITRTDGSTVAFTMADVAEALDHAPIGVGEFVEQPDDPPQR
jgi:hypothetical protein